MTESKTQDPNSYDEFIDLRILVKALFSYKWIILAAVLLAALAGFLVDKFLLDPQYTTSAHIGIQPPTFYANIEPSIENPSALGEIRNLTDLTRSLPVFAEADDIWMSACEKLGQICTGNNHVKPKLEADLIGANQLKLTVTCEDPTHCADFANYWAEEVIDRWNTLYGNESVNLEQISEDVEKAKQLWAESQATLEAYLPESKINVVEVRLEQTKSKLNRYLNEIDSNERLIRNARGLDNRLAGLVQTDKLPLGEALSIIGLQQQITGEVSGTLFQLTDGNPMGANYTVMNARESLNDLINALETLNTSLEEKLPDLELQVTSLALDLESELYAIQRLEGERDRAHQAYQVLAVHLDEAEINQRNQGDAAYCVAKARVPEKDSGQSSKTIAAIAGIVGGVVAVGCVFAYSWWTKEE